MSRTIRRYVELARLSAGLLIALGASAAHATDYAWDAGMGLPPSPPFSLTDSTGTGTEIISNGSLVLTSTTASEYLYYGVEGSDIGLPAQLEVDFRMKFDSGGVSGPRASAGVVISTTTDGVGTGLWIGQDQLLLSTSRTNTVSMGVDTDSAFHDYRIVVDGVNAGSSVSVWQDGVLLQPLSGRSFQDVNFSGLVPRVDFGDPTENISGQSEWQSIGMTSAVPEPSSMALLIAGLAGLAAQRRRSRLL